ncbi:MULTISPECIES: hypothetical protein [unclassified Roseateles]|uniref:hypothetical protein n=1 Tax=Pelomonas sp. Root1237 TaxID=1736434 RepID=UPI0009EC9293
MPNRADDYWFPAKRYGWGWGVPNTWQGWVVLSAFAALLSLGAIFRGQLGHLLFIAYTVAVCLGLVAVCWLKGEPPRWRWGDR